MWIFRLFNIQSQTTQKEVEDNQKYAVEYERIDEINFNSIFSNKLANYVINDSNVNITGENARVELLDKTTQSMWKKAKKITSMGFGYGGVILVPYVKSGKIYYNIVSQSRVTIDEVEGENIIGATIIADKKTVNKGIGNSKTYYRLTNYRVRNGNIEITQKFTDENGHEVAVPDFWKNIELKKVITGVDRALFGYIKSPINNRKTDDKYGVPITYGCDSTIAEIKETMKQLYREYKLKEAFVGADSTMFNGKDSLPLNGLFKKVDAGDDNFFEVFDPAFRPFTERLQELYQRLEHEIGTSRGILTEPLSSYQNTDETRRAMQDTASIIDAMRKNIEKGIEDFLYSANVLANAYNLTPQGEYKVEYDWSYYFIESTMDTWNQLLIGFNNGVVSKEELRAFIYPSETDEVREKALNQIKEEEPSVEKILDSE
jgi:hypothetical protein